MTGDGRRRLNARCWWCRRGRRKAFLMIVTLIIFYWGLSGGLTIYNKWLLSVHDFHFPVLLITFTYTMFVAATQCASAFRRCGDSDRNINPVSTKVLIKYMIPVGILSALEVASSNYSLLLISVSVLTVLLASKPCWVAG